MMQQQKPRDQPKEEKNRTHTYANSKNTTYNANVCDNFNKTKNSKQIEGKILLYSMRYTKRVLCTEFGMVK